MRLGREERRLKSNGGGHRAEIRWERVAGSCLQVGLDVARGQQGTLRYLGKVPHHLSQILVGLGSDHLEILCASVELYKCP